MFFYFYFSGISLKDYEKEFSKDLEKLDIRPVCDENALIRSPELKNTGYFGRPQWKNCARDMRNISHRNAFSRMMYAKLLLKRAVETYYPDAFAKYDNARRLPEFAWESFGFSHEQLPFLLTVPEARAKAQPKPVDFYGDGNAKELSRYIIEKIETEIKALGVFPAEFAKTVLADPEIKRDELLLNKNTDESVKNSAFYGNFLALLKKDSKKAFG